MPVDSVLKYSEFSLVFKTESNTTHGAQNENWLVKNA